MDKYVVSKYNKFCLFPDIYLGQALFGGHILRIVEIDRNSENQRLDKFLLKYFNKAGKSFIYKMLRKKRIKYNGTKALGNEILKSGDFLQMYLSEETINSFMEIKTVDRADNDFSVLYEDENIIICNKPAGLAVQWDSINVNNTLNDQLLFYLHKKGEYIPQKESVFTPSVCNRLDRNTSGIVLFGKNYKSVKALNEIIKNRKIDKFYLTVLKGVIKENDTISAYYIKKENNRAEIFSEFKEGSKKIVTKYKRLAENGEYSLAEVDLITGKSHQIRAGFKFMGYYVIGDRKYGISDVNKFFKKNFGLDNQFLHSYKVIFNDGAGFFDYLKGKEFIAPLDDKKEKIIFELFKYGKEDNFEKY